MFLEVRWSFPVIRFLSFAPARLKGALAAANTPFRQGAFAPLHPPKAKAERGGQSFSSGVAPLSRAHSRSRRIACVPWTGTCVRNGNRHISFCRGTQKFPAWKKMLSFSRKKSSLSRFPPEYLKVNKEKAIILKITLDGSGSHCYHIIRFAQKAQAIQTPIQSGGFWTSP